MCIARVPALRDVNLYLKMIDTTWPRFFLMVTLVFLAVNVARLLSCTWQSGFDHLQGTESEMSAFVNAFFFSVHTLTTVGYGNVFPRGAYANAVAALEAATGLMVFAVMTGLLYGRFSRPSARIIFSNNALVAPYQDGQSLQFRITNARSNTLMNLEARVLLMTVANKDGQLSRKFVRSGTGAAKSLFPAADVDHSSPYRFHQPAVRQDRGGFSKHGRGDPDPHPGLR